MVISNKYLYLSLLTLGILSHNPASSQVMPYQVATDVKMVDENFVDAINGEPSFSFPLLSLPSSGSKTPSLDLRFEWGARSPSFHCGAVDSFESAQKAVFHYSVYGSINQVGFKALSVFGRLGVVYHTPFKSFSLDALAKPNTAGPSGQNLFFSSSTPNVFGFEDNGKNRQFLDDGTEFVFEGPVTGFPDSPIALSKIVFPTGETWTYEYEVKPYRSCEFGRQDYQQSARLKYVHASNGYSIMIRYAPFVGSTLDNDNLYKWYDVVGLQSFNRSQKNCAGVTTICADLIQRSDQWVVDIRHETKTFSIKDQTGAGYKIGFGNYPSYPTTGPYLGYTVTSFERIGLIGSKITYKSYFDGGLPWDGPKQPVGDRNPAVNYVSEAEKGGLRWNYKYDAYLGDAQFEVTNPTGARTRISTQDGKPKYYQDPRGYEKNWSYNYELSGIPSGTLHSFTDFEGNGLELDYSTLNNITAERALSKGSAQSPILQTFSFSATCINTKTCRKPLRSVDPRGFETFFEYDYRHGGMLRQTSPADAGGVRPQTRYGYAQRYAWFKNASGSYSQASTPIWILTSEAYCRTSAASGAGCAGGAADEVVTTYEYEQGSTSKGSNVLLIGTAVTANGQTLRTCFGYDQYGQKISETSPNANLASCP